MARLVSQMSPKTVIKRVLEGKQNKFWISGIKFDKWTDGDSQHLHMKHAKPQLVTIELSDVGRWSGEYSVDRINIIDFNSDILLKNWERAAHGVKFFKDKEHAEKHFLAETNKYFKLVSPIEEMFKELYQDIKHKDPYFIDEIER